MKKRLLVAAFLMPTLLLGGEQFDARYGTYSEKGARLLPTFSFEYSLNGPEVRENVSPIRQACHYLNGGFRSANPEWATRECALVRSIRMPETLIEAPPGGRATHSYMARRVGKEVFQFVLAFGNQEIDVTCVFNAQPYQH